MYKTKKLLKWVDETVIRYTLYLKIEKPEIVYDFGIFLDKIEPLYPYPREHLAFLINSQIGMGRCYGLIELRYKVMLLNVKVHFNKDDLQNTIVHELSHKALDTEKHPKKLYELIEETLKKG